jgi:hypothetical protein
VKYRCISSQQNVSSSFIFTGGDNVANNWETLDFDAVGAIDGEDIDPSGISGANLNAATAGQLLESDGNGQLQFSSPAGGVPSGGIIMWSGSIVNIPSGFALCDGTNGTPDLTDRFVVGAGGSKYSVDDTGGTDTQTVNVSVSGTTDTAEFKGSTVNTSTFKNDNGFPSKFFQRVDGGPVGDLLFHEKRDGIISRVAGGGDSGPFDGKPLVADFSTSGSDSFDNRPAYYALAYIMKT